MNGSRMVVLTVRLFCCVIGHSSMRMYLFGACGVGSREVLLLHVARECGVYEIHAGAKKPAKREVIYEVEKLHREKLVHVPDCACCDGLQYRS